MPKLTRSILLLKHHVLYDLPTDTLETFVTALQEAEAAGRLDMGSTQGLGLAASCRVRGEELFGHAGIESGYLALAFDPIPWLGLVGSYQIVPSLALTMVLQMDRPNPIPSDF